MPGDQARTKEKLFVRPRRQCIEKQVDAEGESYVFSFTKQHTAAIIRQNFSDTQSNCYQRRMQISVPCVSLPSVTCETYTMLFMGRRQLFVRVCPCSHSRFATA